MATSGGTVRDVSYLPFTDVTFEELEIPAKELPLEVSYAVIHLLIMYIHVEAVTHVKCHTSLSYIYILIILPRSSSDRIFNLPSTLKKNFKKNLKSINVKVD